MYRAQIGAGAKASVVVGVLAELWGEGLLSVAEEVTGTPLWHLTVYAVQCPPSFSKCDHCYCQ